MNQKANSIESFQRYLLVLLAAAAVAEAEKETDTDIEAVAHTELCSDVCAVGKVFASFHRNRI